MDIGIRGVEQLDELGDRLRAAGSGGGLAREVTSALERSVAQPLPQMLRSSATSTLPTRGGLAARVARSEFDVSVRSDAGGVRLHASARGPYDLASLDDGRVRHPVFGRGRLVTQVLRRSGWFSRPVQQLVDGVPNALDDATRRVADQITRK